MPAHHRVLLVDLNNFARYPTVAVGYLTAALRADGIGVSLFSPLSHGVEGVQREPRTRAWSLLDQRLRYRTATSQSRLLRSVRKRAVALRRPSNDRNRRKIVAHFEDTLKARPDAILISAYLMYFDVCRDLCAVAASKGIPVVIGGAYFSQASVVRRWLEMPGVVAIVGGEGERVVAAVTRAVIGGRDVTSIRGVWTPEGPEPRPLSPLQDLDDLLMPDYSDFPWDRYPNRIVPIIAGRGCGWGVCSFCSDVTSSMGRTFRSRSTENVLDEVAYQAREIGTAQFIFVDLKLNSKLDTWNGLIRGISKRVPGATWAGSVHVDSTNDHGLDRVSLRAARAAGLVRMTTGVESGSQRVLDRMKKGTDLSVTSRFLHDAREAEISVRTTMIVGYPGETAEDLRETARFLESHSHLIERVAMNRLAVIAGTPLHRQIESHPERFPDFADYETDEPMAAVEYRSRLAGDREHRRAVYDVLAAVHRINRRPLLRSARGFEGVM